MSQLTFQQFELRVQPAAARLEDALLRYISSPQEHDLMGPTAWPFIFRALTGRYPWECRPKYRRKVRGEGR